MSLFLRIVLLLLCSVLISSCSQEVPEAEKEAPPVALGTFSKRELGTWEGGFPWVTGLEIVDIDQDGDQDLIFTEGRLSQVVWLENIGNGLFDEQLIDDQIAGPAGIEVLDMDEDGDLDIVIGGMGIITPNDEKIGSLSILVNDGAQRFKRKAVLENVSRVSRISSGDFDNNGHTDLVLAMFGYFEGETRVLMNFGNLEFETRVLSRLEGAMDAPVADYDGDGDLDIAVLVSQDWEEIYLFDNDGSGNFEQSLLWGSQNKDYGSSGMVAADLDQNGSIDLVFSNGDGFDYATPGARPWHGVQWLSNAGDGNFEYHRIGDQLGSYSPIVTDLDRDGDLDLLVCCAFNDWSDPDADGLVAFLNDGSESFQWVSIAKAPTHLIVAEKGDLDGDGEDEYVTGALHFYPPYENLSRVTLWDRTK